MNDTKQASDAMAKAASRPRQWEAWTRNLMGVAGIAGALIMLGVEPARAVATGAGSIACLATGAGVGMVGLAALVWAAAAAKEGT